MVNTDFPIFVNFPGGQFFFENDKDEPATAGSAKKEIAKTEKQEATIFPGKVNVAGKYFHSGIDKY